VTKVHREAEIHNRRGREIVLIGHAGHPEVVGTMGQLPTGSITLVETLEDVEKFTPRDAYKLAYVTQTTLSVDDTAAMVELLKRRFPDISGPHKEDICYATTNRQDAVKRVAPVVDAMIVVGAPNSSNSQRLKEVAEKSGCPRAVLMQRAADINWADFEGVARLGITAGASAPEVLVEEIMGASRCPARCGSTRRRSDALWRSTPTFRRKISPASCPAMTSANCSPTRASPKALRIPIFWCTRVQAISS
jgi:4-hydroxy-3-methylbut-2-enyl diphosphate reductase